MELRQLRYFVAVAEELHFTRAAERVGIAQPPLSQQIQRLEEEVGTLLLRRTKRRVELTAAGTAFLAEARKSLAQVDQCLHAAHRAARGEVGRLVVGFVSSAAYGQFPAVFRRMRERFPGVSLVLQDLTSEEQVEAMNARQLDVGLVRPPVSAAAGLALERVWSERFLVVLPKRHRLASQKLVGLASLVQDPFLLVPRHLGPGFYDQIIQLCAGAGFSPRVIHEVRATPTIVSLVAGGLGLSIVPASLQDFHHAGVVFRPLDTTAVTDLAVMWRPEAPSPALQAFLQTLRQVADRPAV